ncbi:MAG: ribosome small subunit-dependent GTPase A, partial [Ginsengibacter sp.]
MKGLVYKSTGSWYVVKGTDDIFYNARIKGKFKIDDITSTNPLAVGDMVDFEKEDTEEVGVVINNIYSRKNY